MTAPAVTPEMVIELREEMEGSKSDIIALQQQASVTDMNVLRTQIDAMFGTKIKTALAMTSRPAFDSESSCHRSSSHNLGKAILGIPGISDATRYRICSRK